MDFTVERIQVFKDYKELPDVFGKHLLDYIPNEREKVIVMKEELKGKELYITVKHKKGTSVLNISHFRTIKKDILRTKLLNQPFNKNIEKLLKTL